MYNLLICDAYALAAIKHREQLDKAGKPYLYHCHAVAQAARKFGYKYEIVGVLHDIVEDTDCTLDEIREAFGAEISEAVDAMTHREGEGYFSEYLARVEENAIAKVVKLCDAQHNFSRVEQIGDDVKREGMKSKYSRVIKRLQGANAIE